MALRNEVVVTDKLDDLASHVDDALVSVDELENDPGNAKDKTIANVKDALEHAKEKVDELEDAEE